MNLDDARAKMDAQLETLQREADELRVQAALGKAEAQERWSEVNGRLQEMRAKLEAARGPAGEVLDDVTEKAKELADEVRTGFAKIRDLLS
jgi:type I site-specific restriction endonuclease